MATTAIDSALIQKFLSLLAGNIQTTLDAQTDPLLLPYWRSSGTTNITELQASASAPGILKPDQINSVIHREHDLFSNSSVTSGDAAYELYRDRFATDPENIDPNKIATFEHDISFDLNYSADSKRTRRVYFNIERLKLIADRLEEASPLYTNNEKVNANIKNSIDEQRDIYLDSLGVPNGNKTVPLFKFDRIEIKNRSKDIFTSRSDYSVKLVIKFSYLEDLIKPSIAVYSPSDKFFQKSVDKIPLLFLLYKFYDDTKKQISDIKEGNGFYLTQRLTLNDKRFFNQTTNDLGGTKELYRTLHLTFHKHEIEMFTDDEDTSTFQGTLTIEYVGYETDVTQKAFKGASVPTVQDNLYTLINDAEVGKLNEDKTEADKTIEQYKKILEEREAAVAEYNTRIKCAREAISKKPDQGEIGKLEKQIENSSTELKKIIKDIKTIKNNLNQLLVRIIINNIKFYKFKIPYRLLNTYEDRISWEDFNFNFGQLGTAGAAGAGAVGAAGAVGLTVATGGTALLVGTAVGLTAGAVAQFAGWYNSRQITSGDLDIGDILKLDIGSLESVDINNLYKQARAQLSGEIPSDTTALERLQALFTELLNNNEQGLTDPNTQTDIYFVTFGDILRFLNLSQDNIHIVCGGKPVLKSITGDYSYINYLNYPISADALLELLTKNIIKQDRNFQYSSELFVKNVIDDIIKSSLKTQNEASKKAYENFVPTSITMNYSINLDSDPLKSALKEKTINLLDEDKYKEFKKNLILSKNTIKPSNNQVKKVYYILSDEDVKAFSYYGAYNADIEKRYRENKLSNLSKKGLYSGEDFQEFINKQFLIPCILTYPTKPKFHILKKKYLKFKRLDNPNLQAGNIISNNSIFRQPYQFDDAEMYPYMAFFIDVGSFMFVAPPVSRRASDNRIFGYNGLYLIKSSTFIHRWTSKENPIENMESSYIVSGYSITDGTKKTPDIGNGPTDTNQTPCTDAQAASAAPAQIVEITDITVDRGAVEQGRQNKFAKSLEGGL